MTVKQWSFSTIFILMLLDNIRKKSSSEEQLFYGYVEVIITFQYWTCFQKSYMLWVCYTPCLCSGWDLVEWLERCASIPMITSTNPSSGSELTFRSDLLLTARGGSTRVLLVEFVSLPCYPGNTLCSQRLEPAMG
jgi:hypothetical protein